MLYAENSAAVIAALQQTIVDSKNPKLAHLAVIGIMESENQFASEEMALALRKVWSV